MLILVTGPRASGKDSVANFLKTQGFKRLHLENPLSLMAGSRVASLLRGGECRRLELTRTAVREPARSRSADRVRTRDTASCAYSSASEGLLADLTGLTGQTPASEPMDLDQTTFKDAEAMLDYTTPRWREPFVTTDLVDISEIEKCDKRPWFMVAHVDAPRISRWKRSNGKRCVLASFSRMLQS